jgi:hypothetical protein
MPRHSERANALGELKNEIKHRMADADMRFILDEEDVHYTVYLIRFND